MSINSKGNMLCRKCRLGERCHLSGFPRKSAVCGLALAVSHHPGFTMTIYRFAIILITVFSITACGSNDPLPPSPAEPDLLAVLKNRPSLKKFTRALEATGVAGQLQGGGDYTIFAPMDVAVADTSLDLKTVSHHIIPGRVTFSDLAGENNSYTTLHRDEIEVDATDAIRVGDGLMVESDIAANNGIIHVIDKVLPPGDVPTSLIPLTPAGPVGLTPQTGDADPTGAAQ